MRGKQEKQEPMFAYVRLEEMVPKDHILRKIDERIDFSRVEELTRELYSHTGRPSIDPEVLIRMMVVGYLNGITSERKLCEEVHLNMAYRWFCGLSLEDKVPNHSTFSKNRHGRFAESSLFRELFYDVVRQAMKLGLVGGKHLSVDATTVDANASMESLRPMVVNLEPQAYLERVEEENPVKDEPKGVGPKRTNMTHRSQTDADARIVRRKSGPTRLAYSDNVLMDNRERVIVEVEVTEPQYATEATAAARMVRRARFKLGLKAETIGGDKAYGTGAGLRGLFEAGILPHVPDPERKSWRQDGIFGKEHFSYDGQRDEMVCPAGHRLPCEADIPHKRHTRYSARLADCRGCALKSQCTRSAKRVVSRHWDLAYMERAQSLRASRGYQLSQHHRKRIEHLFGEAKEQMGLRRARRRGLVHVTEQALMTAMVQNIKRIVAAIGGGKPDADSTSTALGVAHIIHGLAQHCRSWFSRSKTPNHPIQMQCAC